MVYPVFDEQSIANRFKKDMIQFKKIFLPDTEDEPFLSEYVLILTMPGSFVELQKQLKIITDRISDIAGKAITEFDYPHDISKYDKEKQKKLWCLRTLLFYQLLISVTEMMKNKILFGEVYDFSTQNKLTPSRTFREDIIPELNNYKMGIFGSISPTSDIDIGIQYSGQAKIVGLAHVVAVFEDSFIIFTGINSLHFDIETYADMMTFPDVTNSEGDVFYLDSSHLTETDFEQLLPYVEASVLRNYVTAQIDLGSGEDVISILKTFNYEDFFKETQIPKSVLQKYLKLTKLKELTEEAKSIIISYMSSSYDDAREKYYDLVEIAEISIEKIREEYFNTRQVKMSNEQIVTIMINICKALVYRAESYTSAPTVMHVVRVLQANANNPDKYKSLEPAYCVTNKLTDAYCNIGPYGYIISLLEQMGYMYRFFITYCDNKNDHYNAEKCKTKKEKYKKRFDNGVSLISVEEIVSNDKNDDDLSLIREKQEQIQEQEQEQPQQILLSQGGRRRKSVRKYKSKKNKRKSKNNKRKSKKNKRKSRKYKRKSVRKRFN